jgi:periplasmic divalent cation tolerance protein
LNDSTTPLLLVTTSSDDRAALERIAETLIELRLAACVQISGPITSYYRWDGALARSSEFLMTAKTHSGQFTAVEAAIRRQHNYQLPEIIATPFAASQDYRQWVICETDGPLSDDAGP